MKLFKQVMVVRIDTDMRKGKMSGQVAHAAVSSVIKSISGTTPQFENFNSWYYKSNQTKAVLKVGSELELEEIAQKAEAVGLVVSRIHDAGHTQIERGTFTCIGIGPDEEDKIDAITGHLKLL